MNNRRPGEVWGVSSSFVHMTVGMLVLACWRQLNAFGLRSPGDLMFGCKACVLDARRAGLLVRSYTKICNALTA